MLTLWNGFDRNFNRVFSHHARLFDQAERKLQSGWPRVEIAETSAALEVTADVPGFTVDELTITLHEGVLTLSGNTAKSSPEGEERKILFSERRSLDFTRTFRVSRDLDGDNISATMKDGVLTVTLPKAEASKPATIPIQLT